MAIRDESTYLEQLIADQVPYSPVPSPMSDPSVGQQDPEEANREYILKLIENQQFWTPRPPPIATEEMGAFEKNILDIHLKSGGDPQYIQREMVTAGARGLVGPLAGVFRFPETVAHAAASFGEGSERTARLMPDAIASGLERTAPGSLAAARHGDTLLGIDRRHQLALLRGMDKLPSRDSVDEDIAAVEQTRIDAHKLADTLVKPTTSVAKWLEELNASGILSPPDLNVDTDPGVKGVFQQMADLEWWFSIAPEYATNAATTLIPATGVTKALAWAGTSARLARAGGLAAGTAIGFTMETGSSYAEMRDDLEAQGWAPHEAAEIAAAGGLAYGLAASVIENITLRGQLAQSTVFREWLTKNIVMGAGGEAGEEWLQGLLQGGVRYAIGLDPEITAASQVQDIIGGAIGGGVARTAVSPFHHDPSGAVSEDVEADLIDALMELSESTRRASDVLERAEEVGADIARAQEGLPRGFLEGTEPFALLDTDRASDIIGIEPRVFELGPRVIEVGSVPVPPKLTEVDRKLLTHESRSEAEEAQRNTDWVETEAWIVEDPVVGKMYNGQMIPEADLIRGRAYVELAKEQEARVPREEIEERLFDPEAPAGSSLNIPETVVAEAAPAIAIGDHPVHGDVEILDVMGDPSDPDSQIRVLFRTSDGEVLSQEITPSKAAEILKRRDEVRAELEKPDEGTPSQRRANRRTRRGMVSFPTSWVTDPVRGALAGTRKFHSLFVDDLISRVERLPSRTGKKSQVIVANKARKAVDVAKESLGLFRDSLVDVLKLASGRTPASQIATFRLQGVTWNEKVGYGLSKFDQVYEGRAGKLTKREREIMDAIYALTERTGREFESRGHKQFDHNIGKWVPFVNYGGQVRVRLQTPEMVSILLEGRGNKYWDQLVKATAHINGISEARVDEIYHRMHEDYNGISQDPASFARINAEFTRAFDRMPSHIRPRPGSIDVIQLLETNPYVYASRLAENAAARIGFVDQFGQDIGGGSDLTAYKKWLAKESGKKGVEHLNDLFRSLSNMPVDDPIIDLHVAASGYARLFANFMSMSKGALLSMRAVVNFPEPLGNIQAFSNTVPLLKAFFNVLSPWNARSHQVLFQRLGATTPDFANFTIDPAQPFTSITRALVQASGRVTFGRYMEEFQEHFAAEAAYQNVLAMKSGKGGYGNLIDIRSVLPEIPIATADRMARGMGTVDEYAMYIRRAPAAMVGGAIRSAEKSRASHDRLYRALVHFELYAQVKYRSLINLSRAYSDAFQRRDAKMFWAANTRAARYLLGTTAAGSGAYFLHALVTGGLEGLEIAWEEMKDHPVRFFRDSFLYSMFAGPFGAIIRAAKKESQGNRLENLAKSILPVFLVWELADALYPKGRGAYFGRSFPDRVGHFFSRVTPINRAFDTLMATFGFGEDEHRMDVAVRAYYRWRYDEKRPGRFVPGDEEEESRKFRWHMKRAYLSIRRRRDPSEDLRAALGVDGRSTSEIASAIRRKKLLAGLEREDLLSLRDRIGEDAFNQIIAHDRILEGWAARMGPGASGRSPIKIR